MGQWETYVLATANRTPKSAIGYDVVVRGGKRGRYKISSRSVATIHKETLGRAMDSLFAGLVILGIVAVSILFAKSAKLVRPDQRMIVERLGAYSRTCGPGWHLIVPFVDRSIVLPLSEVAPGWKGYGEEQLRQKLIHDFYQTANRDAPSRVDTKVSDPASQSNLGPGDRLLIFAFFFGLGVVAFIVELKTGSHVDLYSRRWSITQVHGPWSWDEVWTHLPDELSGLIFLPVCVLAFVVVELWCRFRSRK